MLSMLLTDREIIFVKQDYSNQVMGEMAAKLGPFLPAWINFNHSMDN